VIVVDRDHGAVGGTQRQDRIGQRPAGQGQRVFMAFLGLEQDRVGKIDVRQRAVERVARADPVGGGHVARRIGTFAKGAGSGGVKGRR